jgi:hypothetical protein
MKLVTYEVPSEINYGSKSLKYRSLYNHAYSRMLHLFESNRFAGQTFCYLPKHWSVIVANIFEKMLGVDPGLKFYRVFEKYGKINIEVIPDNDNEETLLELSDLKHEAQNRIDNIVHGMVHKAVAYIESKPEKGETEWLLSKNPFGIIR